MGEGLLLPNFLQPSGLDGKMCLLYNTILI